MFSDREACLDHRDAVVQILQATFDHEPWHVRPSLDAAVVRIREEDLDVATDAFESEGMQAAPLGEAETGDWQELEVKPGTYT